MSFYFTEKPFERFGKTLIEEVNFSVEPGEHVAIIGDNGIGKSTLLTAIYNKYIDSAYLMDQELTTYKNVTALNYILSWFPELLDIKIAMESDYEKIGDYIELNGYEIEEKIIVQAKQLNLSESDLDKKMSQLSGGQQTKVALIRAMVSDSNLILLDEPTNHLDKQMIDIVIAYIKQAKQSVLFVSHHRGFIDETATHIIEINRQATRKFTGNYSQYKAIIDVEKQTQKRRYEKKQQEIKALETTVARVKNWHQSANQSASVRNPLEQKRLSKLAQKAKVKESQINQKIDKIKIQQLKVDERHFHFDKQDTLNKKYLMQLNNLNVTIEDEIIYQNAYFEIKDKENIILTGPNGSGKSLLISIIQQSVLPDEGDVYITPSLKIAYFDQRNDNLVYDCSALSMLLNMDGMERSEAQTILAAFGFDNQKINQPISQLSMGEKSRLQFVILYFSNPHLLILDEPTNYFDIETQDLILQMLKQFSGQVMIVTHDDYLKSQIIATHWAIENKKLKNLTLSDKQSANKVNDTLKLLDEYKSIDEFGHFETDN
ncbi:ABC transporter ATP-binding protein [Staphylococcus gallinarum]|uniref:ABC transporter ATP-binding protein n=1 Tax=Staphylococcus gallinarum TaxID=1293 RepID=A0A3A0VNT3_STAGA|nr:Sal family ABC-F type ribosomal protection protein [Staphylococcus gallinarum]RIP34163.1 ABC transporter ATP-binding protein [Staphylococcus gallinarum]